MPRRREFGPARFRCLDNGHRFEKEVWQWVHTVEEQDEPTNRVVEDPDAVRCPECGSRVEVVVEVVED
jgi:DNA-directed RNA polymerase subunit RPC12/RpoP